MVVQIAREIPSVVLPFCLPPTKTEATHLAPSHVSLPLNVIAP